MQEDKTAIQQIYNANTHWKFPQEYIVQQRNLLCFILYVILYLNCLLKLQFLQYCLKFIVKKTESCNGDNNLKLTYNNR